MTRFVFGIFIVVLITVSNANAQTCDLDQTIREYQGLVASQKLFSALTFLQTDYQQCPHARLLLEAGEIHLRLGATEQAIASWQRALETHELPNSVAQKVKLKILQTRLNPPSPNRFSTVVIMDQLWDQQHITGFGFSVAHQSNRRPYNLLGYAFTPALVLKATGQARYFWASDIFSHATLLSVGLKGNSKPLALETQLNLRELNDTVTMNIETAATSTVGVFSLEQKGIWSLSNEPHIWQQTLTAKLAPVRFNIESEAELFDGKFDWSAFKTRLQGTGQIRPGLSLEYNPQLDQVTAKTMLRWAYHPKSSMSLEAGTRLQKQNAIEWFSQASLVWRPF